MITNADIDIFLLTCERTEYLNDAIKSLLLQSCRIDRIFIVDNSHSDNVENLVHSLGDKRLEYYRTSSLGRHGNYKKILELCTKDYLAIFNDDDIIHPQYIESFLNYKNKFANTDIKIYGCAQKHIDTDSTIENIEFSHINNQFFVTENSKLFLSLLYANFFDCVTPSLIYKREVFLKSNNIELYETYGKLSDSAKLMSAANDTEGGQIVVLLHQAYLYRKHKSQDSQIKKELSPEQFIDFVNYLDDVTCSCKYCGYSLFLEIIQAFYKYICTDMVFDVWLHNFIKEYKATNSKWYISNIIYNRHKSSSEYLKYLIIKYPCKIYEGIFSFIIWIIFKMHIIKL